MRIKRSVGEKAGLVLNTGFMVLLTIITLYPFWYTLVCSFSDARLLSRNIGMLFLPIQPMTLEGYKITFQNAGIMIGLKNTAMYVFGGTLLSMVFTCMGAYATSRKCFRLGGFLLKAYMLTMFFQGGIIPLFFVVRMTGIYNTGWAMILPYLVHTYYLIILRTNFKSLPDSLEESARLDGANDLHIMIRIVLPLSLPALAVVTLYYAVGYWNSWYPALVFMQNRSLYPLQMILREVLIVNNTAAEASAEQMVEGAYYRDLVKYCTVIVSTVPILVVYPLLQRFFVKGMMVGAIKG